MPETEGTQSGESEKPIRPNRIDHLPGSSRDVQFSSLSRVASRIVKDKPRRTDSGRAISPRTDAQSILDSVQYSDAAAIRYLEQVKKVAEPWHQKRSESENFPSLWPDESTSLDELTRHMTQDFDKMTDNLLDKLDEA
ncbi:hypothetical protein EHS25_007919 [Saitozyma podzolica]|uniref:Uncharacterized protein n=1 Tax=Saitozyma podzolica TaxID=1890683 RepID=A0A427YR51_9TREE|nr:hypothetical protein EHS25_007919 [Saitozyma podzolica]